MTERDLAPAAFDAWDDLVAAVTSAPPQELMELATASVRSCLEPAGNVGVDGPAADFAQQITIDVASVTAGQRAGALEVLGPNALAFVQAVWVTDMGVRAGAAFTEMFGRSPFHLDGPPAAAGPDPWPAQEAFLREVAMLEALDVVDAFVWQPARWPPGLGRGAVEALGEAAAAELVLDIVRNAANKIAVAFGADAARVEEGVEYFAIDPATGDLIYGPAVQG